ncbi:sulfotransferase [Salipiger profundus]|uniref:Sulfotransferase family protein n=1 Tax=Salipiger profundus TaxID=1229727 RepID=A0A1U7DE07_9RHOB|nr:sulfotransferase [Salipiger profundus]APX26353.1 Sulfotransferase family protein [Salipiger profundus]GGA21884.1 hypothetical protein GCM10011326_38080 [Salipiger profundus]
MSPPPPVPPEFRAAIDDALELLKDRPAPTAPVTTGQPLPSLLEQCRDTLARGRAQQPPVRLLHHMACTGGTLISRCLAALPNVRLLSEVDPLSTLGQEGRFAPTDMLRLARLASRPVDRETEIELFHAALSVILRDSTARGLDLVLRDHAHSQFCHGPAVEDRPGLYALVAEAQPVCAALTVRHPVDSYLALQASGWMHFTPATIEEYARRYLAFLDAHATLEPLHYEAFVAAPETGLATLCDRLGLRFDPGALDRFDGVILSGDSGRTGATIAARPRRPVSEALVRACAQSPSYAALCDRLGYVADPLLPPL